MALSSSRICQLLMIHMTGGAPFGFRIAAHANGFSPFVVSMIRMNGKAHKYGLQESDMVLAINGFSCYSFITHQSATKLMEYDDPELTLHILRGDNICEDDIRASLQSLDSQILMLTDEEIQSAIAKKQSNEHLKLQVSKSPHISSPSLRTASPFRLQPPPQTRGKQVDKRKDTQTALQHEEQNDAASCDSANSCIKRSVIGLNEQKITISDDKTTAATGSSNEHKNCFKTELNQLSSDAKLNVLEYQQNNDFAQNNLNEFQNQMSKDAKNERNKPSESRFDQKSSSLYVERTSEKQEHLEVTALKENQMDPFIRQDNNLKKQTYVMQKEEQDPNNKEHDFRTRYRVEQTIEFKPLKQSRYYDADSGQFNDNIKAIPQKRRSNSISSYHMYISPIGSKSSSSTEGCNGNFCQISDYSKRREANFNQNMCNNTVSLPVSMTQMSLSTMSASSLVHNQYNILSNITSNVGFEGTSPKNLSHLANVENTISSDNVIGPSSHTCRLALDISNLRTNCEASSSLQVHSPTSVTNRLFGSPSLSLTEVADGSGTTQHQPLSKIGQFSIVYDTSPTLHSHHSALNLSKVDSKPIRVRSSAENAIHEITGSHSVYDIADKSKFQPSENCSKGVGTNTPLRSRLSSTLSTVTRQFEPDKLCRPTHKYNQIIENDDICRSTNVRLNTYANPPRLNLHDSISLNEGKGGRLFARRRANSDAWIVGERNAKAPLVGTSEILPGIRDYGASNSLPIRRRSFLGNRSQYSMDTKTQTIGNNCNHSNTVKYMAVDTFTKSCLAHQPFEVADVSNSLDYSSGSIHQSFGRPAITLSPRQWHPVNAIRRGSERRVMEEAVLESFDQESLIRKQRKFHRTLGYTDL